MLGEGCCALDEPVLQFNTEFLFRDNAIIVRVGSAKLLVCPLRAANVHAVKLCKRKMCLGHGDVREYGAKTQKQENGKTRKRLWTPWKRDATAAARKREYGQTTRKRENGENAKTAKTAKICLPVKVSYMFTLLLLGREQIRFNLMRVSISFYFNGNIENLLLPHDGIARADWNFWKSWHSHHMGFCHKPIPGR